MNDQLRDRKGLPGWLRLGTTSVRLLGVVCLLTASPLLVADETPPMLCDVGGLVDR